MSSTTEPLNRISTILLLVCKMLLDSPKTFHNVQTYGSDGESSPASANGQSHPCDDPRAREVSSTSFEVVDVASKNTKAFKEAQASDEA